MSVTTIHLSMCMKRATYPRGQLDALAAEMAGIVGVPVGGREHKHLRDAVYGQITLTDALERIVDDKRAELVAKEAELAALQVEFVE